MNAKITNEKSWHNMTAYYEIRMAKYWARFVKSGFVEDYNLYESFQDKLAKAIEAKFN